MEISTKHNSYSYYNLQSNSLNTDTEGGVESIGINEGCPYKRVEFRENVLSFFSGDTVNCP